MVTYDSHYGILGEQSHSSETMVKVLERHYLLFRKNPEMMAHLLLSDNRWPSELIRPPSRLLPASAAANAYDAIQRREVDDPPQWPKSMDQCRSTQFSTPAEGEGYRGMPAGTR